MCYKKGYQWYEKGIFYSFRLNLSDNYFRQVFEIRPEKFEFLNVLERIINFHNCMKMPGCFLPTNLSGFFLKIILHVTVSELYFYFYG